MKRFYQFSKGEEERYLAACEAMLEVDSAGRIAVLVHQKTDRYISHQTIRDWFAEPGRIPTDVATMVLVKEYTVRLVDLCPWLKGHVKGRAA